MINMMRADLYRMSKSKGIRFFWLFTAIIYFISIAFKTWGGFSLTETAAFPENTKTDIGQIAMNFTFYFLLIMPVFCVITSEFSEHTLKNTISSSVSKKLYFTSKFFFSLIYSAGSFVLANYIYYIANRLVNGNEYSSALKDFTKAFFAQFPLFIAIVSIFTMLAFLLRKGALYNAVTISAPFACTMISQILISINSKNEFLKKISDFGEKLLSYSIEAMSARVIFDPSSDYKTTCYIICITAVVLSFVLGYFTFLKRELD